METNKPVDWTKPCETEDGRPVRVLCTDRPYEHAPIVCMRDDGVVFTVANDGAAISFPFIKVRNTPPKPVRREGWINVYPWSGDDAQRKIWKHRCDADQSAGDDRIACVKVEWEEPVQ